MFIQKILDQHGSVVYERGARQVFEFDIYEDWMQEIIGRGGKMIIEKRGIEYNPVTDGIT